MNERIEINPEVMPLVRLSTRLSGSHFKQLIYPQEPRVAVRYRHDIGKVLITPVTVSE